MPIYEYRCEDCEQVFEALQRISEEPLDACRHCGGAARRIISSPAIHFVGSGWYVTDYARKGANGKNGSSTKDASPQKPEPGKESSGGKTAAASGAPTSSSAGESRAG